MNVRFPLGLTGLISLLSKGLSRVFSSTIGKHQFFGSQSFWWSNTHIHTSLLEKPLLWLCGLLSAKWWQVFNMLSRFVIVFLLRRKCLLISWLQLLSTVILEPKKIKSVTAFTFSPSVWLHPQYRLVGLLGSIYSWGCIVLYRLKGKSSSRFWSSLDCFILVHVIFFYVAVSHYRTNSFIIIDSKHFVNAYYVCQSVSNRMYLLWFFNSVIHVNGIQIFPCLVCFCNSKWVVYFKMTWLFFILLYNLIWMKYSWNVKQLKKDTLGGVMPSLIFPIC